MTTFNVATQADLNAAIATITSRASTDVINFTANITLSAQLTPLFLLAGANLTINGNNHTIDGANTYGGFVIQNGTVAINDLTIAHMTARGGNGGKLAGNGSGGGAGLGGGLFVGAGAAVTISEVDFFGDRAIGGNGGSSSSPSGGGGQWNGFLGTGFGGGGNGAVSASTHTSAMDGRFGGGGGGVTNYIAGPYPSPGAGGYGAGGGGRATVDGYSESGGGGGLGAGGAIFVDTLGSLTIAGGTISGGAAQGGAGGAGFWHGGGSGSGGAGLGSGIFLHGATITLAPGAGQTTSIQDVIQDGDGIGGLVLKGAGTLELGAANAFSGGITVYGGTLSLGNATAAGSGAIDFVGYGTLQLASGINIANTIKNFSLSDTFVLAGFGITSISFNSSTKILTLTNASGVTKTLRFDVTYSYAGHGFTATTDASGNTIIKIANLLTDGDFKMVDLSNTGPGVTINPTIGNFASGILTGWTGTGQFGAFAPTGTASSAFAGNNVGYVEVGGSVSQTVAAPGNFDRYRLTFDLGSRADIGDGSHVRVSIYAGSTLLGSTLYDTSSEGQPRGSASHWTINTGVLDASLKGLPVQVVISNLAGSQLLFDNVIVTGIDTTAPAVTNRLLNDTGALNNDNVTKVATLTGTGDANAIVYFKVDGNDIAQTAVTNSAGVWTLTLTGLSDGSHTVIARQTDAQGNTGIASLTFTLDTGSPSVAIATVAGNDVVNAAEGASGFTISGTTSGVEDGQVVTVSLNGVNYSAVVTSNAWSLTVPGTDAIADGTYTITANVSDIAGNAATPATRGITINETISVSNVVDSHLVEHTEAMAGTATATASITLDADSSYDTAALASAGWTQVSSNVWSLASTYGTASLDITAGTLVFQLNNAAANALRTTDHPTASFMVPVVDTAGNRTSTLVSFTIDGANDAPVATNDSYTTAEDTPLVIAAAAGVLANDTDVENDALSAIVVTGPAHGTLTLNADGSLSYTADANYNGTDSFTYRTSDGSLNSGIATVDIVVTARNDAPVATSDSYTTGEDTPLVIDAAAGVLANDSDIENDALSAIVVAGPAHGTLTLNADGSLSYTADANYNGADSFTYRAGDGSLDSDITTVDIIVTAVNDAPVAENDSYTASEDTPLVINAAAGVLANDSDVENDTLSAIVVTGPAHGTLTLNVDGSLSYTADANYNGADSFTYRTSDGSADSEIATVDITVTAVNDAPVAENDSYTTSEDTPLVIAAAAGVLANDSDIENDVLSAIVVTGPEHGTLTLNADGSLSYVADANYNGADSFTYRTSDGSADSEIATVDIIVTAVNDAPVAANDRYTASEDTPLLIAAAGVLANDSDVDNDGLSAIVVTGPAHGTLTLNADGSLSYTAHANYNGVDSFTYRTSDGSLDSNVATVSINVTAVDDAATAAADSFTTNEASAIGSGLNVLINNGHGADSDIDGPPLSISAVNGVAGNVGTRITLASGALLTLNADGTFHYDPHGAFDYLPAAGSGASNLTATDSFTYTLAGGNTTTVTITLTGLDSDGDRLDGTAAGDTLNGGIGADTMRGGAGNDVYVIDNVGDTAIEALNQGTDLVRSSVTFALGAHVENLTLTGAAAIDGSGNALNNVITGNAKNNTLNGGDGDDTLNGTTGADRLVGGMGNDTYVTDGGDVIVEAPNQGTDTVQSSATHALAANVENLTLTGAATINGTGNTLANVITGNAAANVLNGATGADRLIGGLGNDTYVTDGGDVIVEMLNEGIDTVQSSVAYALTAHVENLTLTGAAAINGTGNTLANVITGNAAANLLNGATGADRLVGGLGNDTYVTDGGDTIVEALNQGTDTVQSSVTYALTANVENLILTGAGVINGTGNTLANILNGSLNARANVLAGLQGNDIYIVGAGDIVSETVAGAAGGIDTVQSSVTFALTANVENLTLTGAATINGTGNTLANVITGNAAANVLNGAGGADRLVGGLGNDTYVTDGGDVIFEALNQGIDTVQSSVTYTLAANVENLTLTGAATINGTGNTLANVITGNAAANVLDGATGADRLVGGLGNDTYVTDGGDTIVEALNQGTDTVQSRVTHTLAANVENLILLNVATALNGGGNTLNNVITGNNFNNVLSGGLGNDTLIGGAGNDVFVFNTALNAATNRDVIADFANVGANNDTFQLDNAIFTKLGMATGPMNANVFKLSTQVQDANDYIVYNQATGALFYDADGSLAGAGIQFATLSTRPALTAADFHVI